MAAGYLVHGKCVEVAGAYDAYYSYARPEITPGETTYQAMYTKYNGEWHIRVDSISPEGHINHRYTEPIKMPELPSCSTTEQFYDGMMIAWGIVIAMVAAWGIKQIGRAVT